MKRFSIEAGFNILYLDKVSDKSIKEISKVLGSEPWCIVGGVALLLQFGKESRIISPDLDILTVPKAMAKIKNSWPKIHPGTFGFSITFKVAEERLTVDFLAAIEAFDRDCLKSCQRLQIQGMLLPVIDKSHLFVTKFSSGLEKDLKDMKIMHNKMNETEMEKARHLVKEFFPNNMEDFSSTVSMLELL